MTEEEVLQEIKEAAEGKVPFLSLAGEGIASLPQEIGLMSNLKELHLNDNQLTSLPPEIGKLRNLEILRFQSNHLISLPPAIGQLINLKELYLTANNLISLPSDILQLAELQGLYLNNNQLNSLPPGIGRLANLKTLILSNNKLVSLPQGIGRLNNLVVLECEENQLGSIPSEIGGLTSLVELGLSGNQMISLPLEIGQLANLRKLFLQRNRLTSLPSEIGQLSNLNDLRISANRLASLPPTIGQMTNLNLLEVNSNRLTFLPAEIEQLTSLGFVDLQDNLLPIPPEILRETKSAITIINYYVQHLTEEKRPLNEAKMLLVGQGAVGKTCLAKRLIYGDYNPQENKTEGIEISQLQVMVNDKNIRLNIWDFGGQEIMHATHQFFLTKRSIYLLVLDARQGEKENQLEYWLKIIRSYGGDSPVIIVGNKTDQQALDLDRHGLQSKYKNIKAFVETSCETGVGIDELKAVIAEEVGQLEHIHDELLNTWFAVKIQLESMERDYIPYKEYQHLCRDQNITDDQSQITLIGFLHDLGVVLSFHESRLEDTNILNPEWVTRGVYKIINSNELMTQHKGILDRKTLTTILDSPQYPQDKQMFVVDMMRKFELCFDLESHRGKKFLVPDLLTKERHFTGDWAGALAFQYHYDVLPGSVISRFIVRMNRYIFEKTYWRYGVVLAYNGNKALVESDADACKIFIKVSGPKKSRRAFMAIIRHELTAIHNSIIGIEARAQVPLLDNPQVVVSYNHLLLLERTGEESFIPDGATERYQVRQLLDGIDAEDQLEENKRLLDEKRQLGEEKRQLVSETHSLKEEKLWMNRWTVAIGGVVFTASIVSTLAILFPDFSKTIDLESLSYLLFPASLFVAYLYGRGGGK